MKILLFGVSNVGKTTLGTMLAKRLGYSFYDLDEEVKREFHTTLEEFVHMENLRWRDQKRGLQMITWFLRYHQFRILTILELE